MLLGARANFMPWRSPPHMQRFSASMPASGCDIAVTLFPLAIVWLAQKLLRQYKFCRPRVCAQSFCTAGVDDLRSNEFVFRPKLHEISHVHHIHFLRDYQSDHPAIHCTSCSRAGFKSTHPHTHTHPGELPWRLTGVAVWQYSPNLVTMLGHMHAQESRLQR